MQLTVADLAAPVELGRQHLQERRALRRQERSSERHEGGDLTVG
jgi:hypothetical protein